MKNQARDKILASIQQKPVNTIWVQNITEKYATTSKGERKIRLSDPMTKFE